MTSAISFSHLGCQLSGPGDLAGKSFSSLVRTVSSSMGISLSGSLKDLGSITGTLSVSSIVKTLVKKLFNSLALSSFEDTIDPSSSIRSAMPVLVLSLLFTY